MSWEDHDMQIHIDTLRACSWLCGEVTVSVLPKLPTYTHKNENAQVETEGK